MGEQGKQSSTFNDRLILPGIAEATRSGLFGEAIVRHKDLELLQIEMGRPRNEQGGIGVNDTALRTVRHQV